MAQLRKAKSSGVISNFRQAAPDAGSLFGLLADAADAAYSRLEPAAVDEMKRRGEAAGRSLATGTNALTPDYSGGPDTGGVSSSAKAALDRLQGVSGPLKITSAYRTPEHNARVGGAKQSQHLHGNAFDVDVSGMSEEQRIGLIKQARQAGFSGIGVYKNSLHFDVGGDRAWGPSYHRDSLPAWAAAAVASPIGAHETVASQNAPQTIVRTSGGTLEARKYSPVSGPILQAYNAAAQIGYVSEVMDKGLIDLMGISDKFPLDPKGFEQASRGYIDQLVANAPEEMRPALRNQLETEAQRRLLGVYDDYHRDVRQRSANSNKALIDRYSDTYAQALASGDSAAALDAKQLLSGALRARESIPGLAWTPEQSDNVLLDAADAADKLVAARQKKLVSEWGDQLDTIIAAAKDGRSASEESILYNPDVGAALPDKASEAAGYVALRDSMPGFLTMTPDAQKKALEDARKLPVDAKFQVDILKAAESTAKANATAWEKDPIQRAGEVLPDKPPPLPDMSDAPEQIVKALQARRAYSNGLVQAGYTDTAAFLSQTEADTLGALMSKTSDPEARAALAATIVAGFGEDAAGVFRQMKTDDPVTLLSGQLLARGGDLAVATKAMRGQQLLDEGVVQVPQKADRISAISTDLASALDAARVPVKTQGDILKMAVALYASDARGVDPTSDAATELMNNAVQEALGQSTDRRGNKTGGVQEIHGFQTLLPPGVSGDRLSDALDSVFKARPASFMDRLLPLGGTFEADPAAWDGLGSGRPNITANQWFKDQVRLVPVSGNTYRMEVTLSDGLPRDVMDDQGNVFTFDAAKLIESAQ